MKVRAGGRYVYDPVLWDTLDPKTSLKPGDVVRVIKLPGAPPPNTMGHCHVANETGEFVGLVHCNSLHKLSTGLSTG